MEHKDGTDMVTDEMNTVYVTDLQRHMIHIFSEPKGSVITPISLMPDGVWNCLELVAEPGVGVTFLHIFSLKSICVRGWHPPNGSAPRQQEILDLPLGM